MDRKIIWTDHAVADLESIANYIAKDSKFYASSFVLEIKRAGKSLKDFYERGRVVPEYKNSLIRELFIKEYRLIYKIDNFEIKILTIVHGRRKLSLL